MEIVKKGFIKVPTQPKDFDLQATGLVFKSYDKEIALELHIAKQDGKPADLLGANVRLLMNIYEEVDGVVTKDPVPFIASNLITESYLNGVVKYILPDSLKAYNGTVETFVYVDYPDNSSSDNIGFTFRMEKSKIDKIASGKAEYFIQDFKALLAEVNLQVDEFSANVTELQNEVKTIGNEVKAIESEVKSLTKLQTLYSNSLDFGDYDYSGNPNLFVNKLESSDFIKGNHGSLTDDNGILHFTSDGTGDINMLTSANMPSVSSGKTYTLSAKLRFDEGTTGDINKLRLTYRKTPEGSVLLEANNTSVIIDDVGKEITIKCTASVAYEITNLDRFFIGVSFSRNGKINGGFKLYDIKIEEGSTATPYQPNLLDAPYYLSKVPLGENIADPTVKFPITLSGETLYAKNALEDFILGETYTVTIGATKPASQTIRVHLAQKQFSVFKPVEGLVDTWVATVSITQLGSNPKWVYLDQTPNTSLGPVQIDWLKIEKGDARTPNIERHRYKGLALLGTTEPTKYEWELSLQGEKEDLDAAKAYTDKQVQAVTTAANSYTDTAKAEAINSANEYANARKTEAVTEADARAQNKVTALENKLTAISHLELNITNGNTGSCHLYRQGKIVTLYFQNLCGKSSGGADSKIADLPEGSFPPATFEQLVGSTDRSTLNSATIEITSSGTIWWKRNTAFGSGYTFIVTYVLG